jgi:tetratricopeptide (TPR) repeat protein
LGRISRFLYSHRTAGLSKRFPIIRALGRLQAAGNDPELSVVVQFPVRTLIIQVTLTHSIFLGVLCPLVVSYMRPRFLLPFLTFPLLVPSTVARPQTTLSTQAASASRSKLPKWTEAERKVLLAKAQQGDRGAQFWLGAAYEGGWFGKSDFQEALKWLRKAAAHGDPDAQVSLGQMYEEGEGVQQNYKLAAKWYRKAADHVPDLGGAGQGRNQLGLLYLDGLGVPKDYVQAYMWFSLANTETNLSDAKAQMTPAQVLKAERMAAKWKSHHPER